VQVFAMAVFQETLKVPFQLLIETLILCINY
jgi:hypothetical protein